MRRLAAVAALLAAIGAWFASRTVDAQTNGALYAAKTFTFACPNDGGGCTGAAPTSDTDGVSLTSAGAYTVSIDAAPDGGTTTLASGGAKCYFQQVDYSSGTHATTPTRGWTPCKSTMDVAAVVAGRRRYTEPTFSVGVGEGRVKYVPSAIVVTSPTVGETNVNLSISVQRVQTETR